MKYSKMDLTGKKFGKLTVIEHAGKNKGGHILWKCKCDCGNETIVTGTNLRTGNTMSCGCLNIEKSKERFIDLTGRKFGRLTVIEQAERTKAGRIRWKCICDCGREVIINGISLRGGNAQSCGHHHKKRTSKPLGEASFNHTLEEYEGQSKKGNKKYSKMDLTGKKLGKLTVIERAEKSKSGVTRWKCKCDCGNEAVVSVYQLLNENTKSCGCLNREMTKARASDLTGLKFNRLTVIEQAERTKTGIIRWKCKCDCGNETIVSSRHLLKGNTKSCGCLTIEKSKERIINLVGKRYGKLVVIERAVDDKKDSIRWKCKCDCGNEIIVDTHSLRTENTKSCGCLHRERISKPLGEAYFNRIIKEYKRGAKERNKEFSLSEDEFKKLILADCFYCGAKPSQQYKNTRSDGSLKFNGVILYNGIDRIDSSQGYVTGNVVTCCKQCNYAKHNYTQEEFELWVKAVYEHLRLSEGN